MYKLNLPTDVQYKFLFAYVQNDNFCITQSENILNILRSVQTVLLDSTTNKFVYIRFRVWRTVYVLS